MISLVAISRTSYASFNSRDYYNPHVDIACQLQVQGLTFSQRSEVVYLSANWKLSPMHIPLRPFCLKLAGGIAERNTKDHTRFPHPQAALEHFDDIEDLGVGTPRKIGFCSLKQRWSYPHFDAMSQSRQVSWLQANVTHSAGNLIGFNRGMYKTSLGFEHHDLDVRLISWMSLVILSQTRNFICSVLWMIVYSQFHPLPGTAMKCKTHPWKNFCDVQCTTYRGSSLWWIASRSERRTQLFTPFSPSQLLLFTALLAT